MDQRDIIRSWSRAHAPHGPKIDLPAYPSTFAREVRQARRRAIHDILLVALTILDTSLAVYVLHLLVR